MQSRLIFITFGGTPTVNVVDVPVPAASTGNDNDWITLLTTNLFDEFNDLASPNLTSLSSCNNFPIAFFVAKIRLFKRSTYCFNGAVSNCARPSMIESTKYDIPGTYIDSASDAFDLIASKYTFSNGKTIESFSIENCVIDANEFVPATVSV